MERIDLFKKISDFLFSSFRWGCQGGPAGLEPKPVGLITDLLEYQRTNNPVYRQYCEEHGRTSRGSSILDYPPLPFAVFQNSEVCLQGPRPFAASFVASMPDGSVCRHNYIDTGLLHRSGIYAFTILAAKAMHIRNRVFSLLPENDASSMAAFRFSSLVPLFGTEESACFGTGNDEFDEDACLHALEQAAEDGVPFHLLGNVSTCRKLASSLHGRSICSAEGSCIHLSDAVIPSALCMDLCHALGIPEKNVIREIGNICLSSQGYQICALNTPGELPDEPLFVFPGWLKCFIYNPESLSPVLPGSAGQIAFLDLCNLDSAAFVLTPLRGELVQLDENLRARVPCHPKYALRLLQP